MSPKKVCYNSLVPGSISVAGHDILLRLVLVPAHAATLDKNGKIFSVAGQSRTATVPSGLESIQFSVVLEFYSYTKAT